MKKPRDGMRKEYRRADFRKLGSGTFYAEASEGTSVALLDPVVAKAFPTSRVVNEALHGLLESAEQASLTHICVWLLLWPMCQYLISSGDERCAL